MPAETTADRFEWHKPGGDVRHPTVEVVKYLDAVKSGNVSMLLESLVEGAHVDTKHRCGMTGLIVAADLGHDDVVACLIEKGADTAYKWSKQNSLFYAEKNKDGKEGDSEEKIVSRRRTYALLLEHTAPPSETPEKEEVEEEEVPFPEPPPKPPLHYQASADKANLAQLVAAVSNSELAADMREDAAWALRELTSPDTPDFKPNTEVVVEAGAVEPLAEMLRSGQTHGCKEQAIAVLRNIARCCTDKSVGHHIRKVIREEAIRWAGVGTPESNQRVAEMEKKIRAAGGVCVVKSDAEIEKALAALEQAREEK